ncbi:hypothetical protein CGSSa00_10903 [Staphylococcus aureus subsp. aureus CGS00]|uniref:Uncharacterized protein n=1 Tax=Staphylococcus aureus (strain MRSA252) TaxID=282458 RepID=A0A7U7ETV3_STAAR|nr:conserved hypothetical protein [Staphylococcus aureus subsp. aureus 65-1322]EFB45501.1 hypothetical protein SARG_00546 [Staphylococcus aureus subsp. aureus C101]EFB48279.1 hypothetical protein SASG_02630 [Staphylococcus aureus subsp. aureus C427]EFB54650.1 conserved hypothetical protein [Staphylococcus aureus subsp. aureus WBG10049]EFU23569.1 hypothetical protein CGSSa00_10903 [Staphylococcus aureus subsp. aureus CGS00]CAG39453.1 hypothetical protein SAR0432 [Staphylococcus aureus subsp. au
MHQSISSLSRFCLRVMNPIPISMNIKFPPSTSKFSTSRHHQML